MTGVGRRSGDSDGDRVLVDIQAEIEFIAAHGVPALLPLRLEPERALRRRRGRSCGSARSGHPRPQ